MTTQIDFTRLIGTRYGRLEVKAIGKKRVRWGVANYQYLLCACDCGKEKEIVYTSLLRGRTKSCGCLRAAPHQEVHCASLTTPASTSRISPAVSARS